MFIGLIVLEIVGVARWILKLWPNFELAQKTALYHQIGVWQLFKAGNGYNAHLYN